MNAPANTHHLLPAIAQRDVPQALIDALKARFAERCSTALVVREQHGRDESSFDAPPPTRRTPETAAPGRFAAKKRSSTAVISLFSAAR